MTLLFVDGFDHYATADLPKKGWVPSSTPDLTAGIGVKGTAALNFGAGGTTQQLLYRVIPAGSSFIVGFHYYIAGLAGDTSRNIIRFYDGVYAQLELNILPGNVVTLTRNGTLLGTLAVTITPDVWAFIELKFTIANSIPANSCVVRVDGAVALTLAAGTDTQATANATVSLLAIGHSGLGGASSIRRYDNFYLCDPAGSANNDFLGEIHIDTLFPNADGTYSDLTPSTGADHFALVDEATPNTTDYNSSATPGHRDSYGLSDLPAITSPVVFGVQVTAAAQKSDAGVKTAATMVRSGSTDADGDTVGLSTSQRYISDVYETDPNTSAAWTQAGVNAMQAGVKVVA